MADAAKELRLPQGVTLNSVYRYIVEQWWKQQSLTC